MPQARDAQGRFVKRRHPRRYPKGHRVKLRVVKSLGPKGYRKSRTGPLVIPMKVGYSYVKVGTGAAVLNFGPDPVGFSQMPNNDWLARWSASFDYVRINKIRMEITCPYNTGQSGIGQQSLYRMWYKRALTTAETVPDTHDEWLCDQRAVRKTFNSNTNSINLYWTPSYESTVQPLNTAVTQLRTLSRQWQTIRPTAGAMTPHIGALATLYRLDGGNIETTNSFRINVTMYCELKGAKEL